LIIELTNLREIFICKNNPEDFIYRFANNVFTGLLRGMNLMAEAKGEEKSEEEVEVGLFKSSKFKESRHKNQIPSSKFKGQRINELQLTN